jgi:hypothetical protein
MDVVGKDLLLPELVTNARLRMTPRVGSNRFRYMSDAGMNSSMYFRQRSIAFSISRLLQIFRVACLKKSFSSTLITASSKYFTKTE